MSKAKVPVMVALLAFACFGIFHLWMTRKCEARAAVQYGVLASLVAQGEGELKKDQRGNDFFEFKAAKGLKITIKSILHSNGGPTSGDPYGLLFETRISRGPEDMPTLTLYRPGPFARTGSKLPVSRDGMRDEPLFYEAEGSIPDSILRFLEGQGDPIRALSYDLDVRFKRFFLMNRRKRLTMVLFYNFTTMPPERLEGKLAKLNRSFIDLSRALATAVRTP